MERCGRIIELEQETTKALAFFTNRYVLSNHFSSPIQINGVQYPTAEHYYMHKRSLSFNDNETAQEILAEPSPRKVKTQLVYNIKGFDANHWDKIKLPIMAETLILKFFQNLQLWEDLKSTGDYYLIEASPSDKYWGAYLGLCELKLAGRYTGQNTLGKLLMSLRSTASKSPEMFTDAATAAFNGNLEPLKQATGTLLAQLKKTPKPQEQPCIQAQSSPRIPSRKRLPSYNNSNITDPKKSKGIQGLERHLDGALILTDGEDGNSPPPPFSSSAIAPSTPRIIRFEHDHPKYIICQIGHEPEMATAVKAQFHKNSIGYPSSLAIPLCS